MTLKVLPGQSYPLGATVYAIGVNFCIYSKHATGMDLLLFDGPEDPYPARTISLDPRWNRTFQYWHALVPGLKAGQVYAYRAHGPYAPDQGYRFDPTKVLFDPYARAIAGEALYDREAAIAYAQDNSPQALRSVVVDNRTYDWEGDRPLRLPFASSIIYEMHVGGFTRHPNSGLPDHTRGTYAGVIEKIPYLQALGITAVELLPIHQFDRQDARPGLENYWGYSTLAFFAPHRAYSSRQDPLGPVDEFRDMVKALHKAGIEVILDVVFNHTAEGNHEGPTLSFRGLDNHTYYILDAKNPAYYANFSGCGNSVKANHAVVGRMIIDSLRYWVSEMHVDGFRFDLASVLARDMYGHPVDDPPILWSIESDPILAGTKMIAEAWDAAGLYQVGSFIGDRFAEWNGPYRDHVRRFVKGDRGAVPELADRILGSPDIYPSPDREPDRSIHFVTCHDGFTLNDLVSYNRKHNEANGEHCRDGTNDNHSWNCGYEGPTDNPEIEKLRLRQIKNLLTLVFFSQGTPMLLMGDEVRHTQLGNNNAYCQDNELSWFNWDAVEKEANLLRFTQGLIRLTQKLKTLQVERVLTVTDIWDHRPHVVWHGTQLKQPDWSENSHSLAFTLRHPAANEELHIMLNAYWEPLIFELPDLEPNQRWYRIVDTAVASPRDFCDLEHAPMFDGTAYPVGARSSVVLMAQKKRL
ncbi:glycogen debranching protein GlgX [Pseudanabaena sp. FACHB-2040]|uniref:glycogen debranching protein GlgX n=1 Tax=Pseudanabaena sp. FACHB-2040 TaxID=2692859 RepID=UPI001683FDCA|nr:glycogen debranching protein GlgX [Pseudanabaena sp. FACHB-2040]MBD2256246.1 glycogen debranching protein GlgX [Pseudanabaena sp. FACHB-2040]